MSRWVCQSPNYKYLQFSGDSTLLVRIGKPDHSDTVAKYATTITSCFLPLQATMGKLNIAHHKSYHPYRRDNIEKVRRDEEEARQKEAKEEGRMMLAVRQSSITTPIRPSDGIVGLGGPDRQAARACGLQEYLQTAQGR
jgi:hypothetical protein